MSSCCANMTEFAEVTDTLKEMTISDPAPVGDEMTQDDAPVTIGATVPTGFESTAADEVKEKLGCVCKIGKDRGKIYFEIKKERLAEVHRLKSVDNLFVIVEEFTDFYFSEIKEAALEDLKNLAAKLSWERALSTWEMNNSLKKKKKRKKAGNGSKEKKQLTAVPGDESGSPKEEHPATPQPEEALQLDCSDGSSSQPPPAEEIPAGPSSQPPPAEEIPAGPSSQPPPAEAIPAGPSSQPPPAEEIPAGLSSQPPPAEEIPAGPSSQPPPREEIPAGPDSQTSQEAGDEDSVIKSEPPDEGNPDPSHVLKFRVTCSRAGDNHSFTSNDAARDFGGAVQEHFQWKADMKNFDVEVLLNISFTDMVVGIALTEESLHRRNITHFGPTTLRSTLAYGMLRLCNLKPSDVIIDPMCGTGAIPIEGVSEWPSCFFLAGDNNSQAVNRAASNICSLLRKKPSPESVSSGLPIDAVHWDISKLPLRSGSVDVIITDMPFGKRIGSKKKNWDLYPACLREMSRVCRAGTGRAVLLTHDRKCFVKALAKVGHLWKKMYTVWVNIGGLHAGVYLLKRTLPNAEEHSGEAEERVPDLHTTEE